MLGSLRSQYKHVFNLLTLRYILALLMNSGLLREFCIPYKFLKYTKYLKIELQLDSTKMSLVHWSRVLYSFRSEHMSKGLKHSINTCSVHPQLRNEKRDQFKSFSTYTMCSTHYVPVPSFEIHINQCFEGEENFCCFLGSLCLSLIS